MPSDEKGTCSISMYGRATGFLVILMLMSVAGAAQNSPTADSLHKRGYPDTFQSAGAKEQVWTIYYSDIGWEGFLIYQVVLLKKGYEFEGGTPAWLTAYVEDMTTAKPADLVFPLTVTAQKPGWAKVRVTYYPEGQYSPDGFRFSMQGLVWPSAALLSGEMGPHLNPEDYMPYLKHLKPEEQVQLLGKRLESWK